MVDLTDEVDAEAMVRFLRLQDEAASQIDRARGHKRMIGPQSHLGVAGLRSESDAGVDEPTAESAAPASWFYQQDAQLCGVVIFTDAEHATDSDAVKLGDPRSFP